MCVRACACVDLGARALACACERVALLIQHAKRRHIAICGLSVSTIFFYIILETVQFSEKVIEHEMCIFILSTTFI